MKQVTVVCLAEDRDATVDALQELGTIHVVDVQSPETRDVASVRQALAACESARTRLAAREIPSETSGKALTGDEILAEYNRILHESNLCREEMSWLHRQLARLEPWGSFSRETIAALEASGYDVVLSSASESALGELRIPETGVFQEVSRQGKTVYFAVIVPAGTDPGVHHRIPVPEETDATVLQARLAACEEKVAGFDNELDRLAFHTGTLEKRAASLAEELAFLSARDGMGEGGRLRYLGGFIPAKHLDSLLALANQKGWAVTHEDASVDDPKVPTLITLPRLFRIAKPIFEFIGIAPAYNEADVSICVLVFLTIFFGMIVGDAAYGVLFLGAAIIGKVKSKNPKMRLPLNLFILLSLTTIFWGWLNGTWFAIPAEKLPAALRGIPLLTDETVKNQNIQWLCFLIAALHLSLARAWKAVINAGRKAALGHAGWALLIWGNFFTAVELIVFKGSFPKFAYALYALGLVLVLVFGVNWKDVGEILNLPFGFIGSFVDVLSYIRLFAVGLSSFYIARSFNDMGTMVLDLSPWLFPGAAIIILAGHVLNIALGFLGVLVHGVRLNTLEFSNHMELTWSGRKYNPLRKAEAN